MSGLIIQSGLALPYLAVLLFFVLQTRAGLFKSIPSNSAPFSLPSSSTSLNFPLPLIARGFVMVVRVSGGVLGHLSSSSLLKFTPPFMHRYVMVAR